VLGITVKIGRLFGEMMVGGGKTLVGGVMPG
jgi:hypothetical protein